MSAVLVSSRRGKSFRIAVSAALVFSMLTGCATNGGMGQKEQIGTGAGALLGGIAGAFIGSGGGKVVAVLAGAALGGLLGNRLGAMLDAEDQKELQTQAQHALLTQPDNATTNWSSQHSDATATVVPQNTRVEQRKIKIVRDVQVASPGQLDSIGAQYVAKNKTSIHAAPTASGDVTGSVNKGSAIWVVGKVHDQPWLMVARGGKSIGYVAAGGLAPAPAKSTQAVAAASNKSSVSPISSTANARSPSATPTASPAFDLVAQAPVRTPADLDALAPNEKSDEVVASVMCRDIKTTATVKGQTETSTQTACKSPDGSWDLG
jgi:surface antigen